MFTALNLNGIHTSARINEVLAAGIAGRRGDLFRIRRALSLGIASVWERVFHAALLQSGDVQLPWCVSRHFCHLLNFTILIANVGSGMGAQLAAARLLYGMGRSDAIPGKFFGAIEPKRRIPINSVLIGAITLIGALFIS